MTLNKSYNKIKTALETSVHGSAYGNEFYNSYHLVDSLSDKIKTQITQLNPIRPQRLKRGIVDGLGSIIKAITGNLDQEDARKYNEAIETLSNNQFKIKTLIKGQITLLQSSIEKFKNNTNILIHNQGVLESRIMQLEKIIKIKEHVDIELASFYLQILLFQIITAFQAIYDVLEKIEVAITFAKLNTFHNSIIDPNDLVSDISLIGDQLKNNKLPFEPILENILMIEKIMEIKSYSKGNQIIFIIEIPIVENQNYNYYHLYPLPTPTSNSFKAIIPQSKFLLSNEQSYALTNIGCQEITPDEFLCQQINPTRLKMDSPCEVQILNYANNLTNCKRVPFLLKDAKVQKVEKNQWIIISPINVVAVQKCGKYKDNVPLNGTYLIELNDQCEVRINDNILKTVRNVDPNSNPFRIPRLDFAINKISDSDLDLKPLEIDSLNLDEFKNIQTALETQRKNLDKINSAPIRFHSVSAYTILLYAFICLTIFVIICYRCLQKYKMPKVQSEQSDVGRREIQGPPNVRLSNPVRNP